MAGNDMFDEEIRLVTSDGVRYLRGKRVGRFAIHYRFGPEGLDEEVLTLTHATSGYYALAKLAVGEDFQKSIRYLSTLAVLLENCEGCDWNFTNKALHVKKYRAHRSKVYPALHAKLGLRRRGMEN